MHQGLESHGQFDIGLPQGRENLGFITMYNNLLSYLDVPYCYMDDDDK